ncbi:MAG: 1,4-dihydroxy-2-naphthoate polyprenyltransferase [Acidimicrobiales bacterium]|nr:1,4-dihydroxy-2-naphthoate polyprenyltransferase [Acidimicrobiales bacterium]
MSVYGVWLAGARPRTWPAAIVPVMVGSSASQAAPEGVRVILVLVVALFLQIGVNYANDYSDGIRGSDDSRVGPMRLVASGAAKPLSVRRAALLSFVVAAVAGLYLAVLTSLWLVPIGAAAIVAAWCYTGGPRPYGYSGLGELFVFVFFGLVASVGSTYVQDEEVTALAVGASIPVGLLAVALLVTNNLRDLPKDALVGKNTLAVRMGDKPTRVMYVLCIVMSVLCLPYLSLLRPAVLIAVLSVLLAVKPIRLVARGATGQDLVAVLGATGKLQMLFGVLLSVGLAIGI